MLEANREEYQAMIDKIAEQYKHECVKIDNECPVRLPRPTPNWFYNITMYKHNVEVPLYMYEERKNYNVAFCVYCLKGTKFYDEVLVKHDLLDKSWPDWLYPRLYYTATPVE